MNSTAQQTISIDVTSWPEAARVKALRALDAIALEVAVPVQEQVPVAWDDDVLMNALLRLTASNSSVQIKAIKRALDNLGTVTRAEIYEIGGYPSSRSLKGFTRPCNRVTKDLKREGELPADAAELLVPIYDPDVKGFQQAKAFRIPDELVWSSK
jgi:hypothetical protein